MDCEVCLLLFPGADPKESLPVPSSTMEPPVGVSDASPPVEVRNITVYYEEMVGIMIESLPPEGPPHSNTL